MVILKILRKFQILRIYILFSHSTGLEFKKKGKNQWTIKFTRSWQSVKIVLTNHINQQGVNFMIVHEEWVCHKKLAHDTQSSVLISRLAHEGREAAHFVVVFLKLTSVSHIERKIYTKMVTGTCVSGDIRFDKIGTIEKISMAPAQGWHAQFEKWSKFFSFFVLRW